MKAEGSVSVCCQLLLCQRKINSDFFDSSVVTSIAYRSLAINCMLKVTAFDWSLQEHHCAEAILATRLEYYRRFQICWFCIFISIGCSLLGQIYGHCWVPEKCRTVADHAKAQSLHYIKPIDLSAGTQHHANNNWLTSNWSQHAARIIYALAVCLWPAVCHIYPGLWRWAAAAKVIIGSVAVLTWKNRCVSRLLQLHGSLVVSLSFVAIIGIQSMDQRSAIWRRLLGLVRRQ